MKIWYLIISRDEDFSFALPNDKIIIRNDNKKQSPPPHVSPIFLQEELSGNLILLSIVHYNMTFNSVYGNKNFLYLCMKRDQDVYGSYFVSSEVE